MNRDKKKKNKPYRMDEFYFYESKENKDLPEPKYGAAALELIRRKMFPIWGLFVYKELKERAGDALPPELLCFSCDDAIILAPSINDGVITGMLIASKKVSEKAVEMRSPCGKTIMARLPKIEDTYIATEDCDLRLLG